MSGVRHYGRARRVRARHRDLARPVRRHRHVRARAGGRGAARRVRPARPRLPGPAAGAVVEADLQRDREHGRGAHRPAARRRRSPASTSTTDLGHLVHDLMDEGKAVAAAAGVELHEDPWEMNVHAVRRGETLAAEGALRPRAVDARGRPRAAAPTEVDFITGALVREAASTASRCRCTRPCTGSSRSARRDAREGRVVGCGAVGSLFAANLGTLDDVEVWAYDLWQAHVDAINAHGLRLSGAGEVVGQRAGDDRSAALPPATSASSRPRACTPTRRWPRPRMRSQQGAVCSVQNGAGNEELVAEHVQQVIRGTTFPAGPRDRAGPRRLGHEGRHAHRPVRAEPGADGRRSRRSPTPAPAAGCRRTRSRTRAAPSGAS